MPVRHIRHAYHVMLLHPSAKLLHISYSFRLGFRDTLGWLDDPMSNDSVADGYLYEKVTVYKNILYTY